MKSTDKSWLVPFALAAAVLLASAAEGQIQRTPHNLSATGVEGSNVFGRGGICAFCHTPHSSGASRALWNQRQAPILYNLYASSTLEAKLGQPTGISRLCLGCHDGTTARANVGPGGDAARVSSRFSGEGKSLGTDLSDDHPISFVYDSALALRRGELADPAALSPALRIDQTRQMQCTTCHDPHDDRYGKFLRMDNSRGGLCTSCHRMRNWTASAHGASRGAAKGCLDCHSAHSAAHPVRLLNNSVERAVCLACHGERGTSKKIEQELFKLSRHPVAASDWVHDPKEDPENMVRHVTCVDCHNPHQTVEARSAPPFAPGALRGVRGLSITGQAVKEAAFEYEVCLKCHGVSDQTTAGRITRRDNVRNVRLEFQTTNPSFHPVASRGKNVRMSGFEPGYTNGSIVACTDCHNNDAWTPNGKEPRGPHGSRHIPILESEYQVDGQPVETFQAYGMCYKCHNRDFLITDGSRTFGHDLHVVKAKAPCAVCHDAHGSRRSVGLINFMVRDRTGRTVVSPSRQQGRLEHISIGRGRGQCFLLCHGKNHEPLSYP